MACRSECLTWRLVLFALACPLAVSGPATSSDFASLTVPIVISSSGLAGSFYTSELSLTNRGTTTATVRFTYTAAFGGGGGSATDSLPAGRQKTIPDAIQYLISIGLPIPASGNRGGVLRVDFTGLSSSDAGAVTARTTTAVPGGRAGLSYPAFGNRHRRRRLSVRPQAGRYRPVERRAPERGRSRRRGRRPSAHGVLR